MTFSTSYLQASNNPIALLEWLALSAALVLVVTLIYVLVLNRTSPPEGLTQAKLEQYATTTDSGPIILSAQNALKSGDGKQAVDLAVKGASVSLAALLGKTGVNLANMNVSDLAYLVQTRAARSPDITQPLYQLNLLHLKAAQNQPITAQEAEWAISTATWLSQLILNGHISL